MPRPKFGMIMQASATFNHRLVCGYDDEIKKEEEGKHAHKPFQYADQYYHTGL